MKKTYEKPELEIIVLTGDVITDSCDTEGPIMDDD